MRQSKSATEAGDHFPRNSWCRKSSSSNIIISSSIIDFSLLQDRALLVVLFTVFCHQLTRLWRLCKMYLFVVLLFSNALHILAYTAHTTSDFRQNHSQTTTMMDSGFQSLHPFSELARVLDIQPLIGQHRHVQPPHETPDFFYKLYKSLATESGESIGPTPYHADLIYGHLSEEGRGSRHFKYGINRSINQSNLITSEFHLYRLPRKTGTRTKRSTRFLIVKLYMVTSPARSNTPYGNHLLDIQRIPLSKYGWIVFNSTTAVERWVGSSRNRNYGFFVSVQNTDSTYPSQSVVQFIPHSTVRHHRRLQPIVAVYTRSGDTRALPDDTETELTKAFINRETNRYQRIYSGYYYLPPNRVKRSDQTANSNRGDRGRPSSCSLYAMPVEFERMGWNQWIIGPRSFNAGLCAGPCPYPIGQSYHPTNHAVVQSIWYHLNPQDAIIGPVCCVAHTLASLRMLYYNSEKVVLIKTYDNMIVKSCGCK